MIVTSKEQKQQEARNFLGRKGLIYILTLSTKEEKKYFEGSIYNSGIPDSTFISCIASPTSIY